MGSKTLAAFAVVSAASGVAHAGERGTLPVPPPAHCVTVGPVTLFGLVIIGAFQICLPL